MPVHPGIRESLIHSHPDLQRLVAQHSEYEAQLQALAKQTYLNNEDLLLEVELKKRKLRIKDELEELVSKLQHQSAATH